MEKFHKPGSQFPVDKSDLFSLTVICHKIHSFVKYILAKIEGGVTDNIKALQKDCWSAAGSWSIQTLALGVTLNCPGKWKGAVIPVLSVVMAIGDK